jgi:autotransporter-associated beta strand protein/T5SS/PEP-CTERM-associated repeat protein
MKLRALIVAASALALSPGVHAFGPTTPTNLYVWTGAADGSFANPANWIAFSVPPSSASQTDLVFPGSPTAEVSLATAHDVRSLTFTGQFPHYYLTSAAFNAASLGLGAGGVLVDHSNEGANDVDFAYGLPIRLLADQTWETRGNLSAYGDISGDFALTKTGAGSLALGGNSGFTGGLTVAEGTLYLANSTGVEHGAIVSGPVGTGTLTLGDNTTVRATYGARVELANDIALGNYVHFDGQDFGGSSLEFGGTIRAAQQDTTVFLSGDGAIFFSGSLAEGPAGTHYTFTGGGLAVLTGANTYTGGTSVLGAGLIFYAPQSLPAVGGIAAPRSAYIGAGFSGGAAAVIAKLVAPAEFNGTLGLDTDPSAGPPTIFTDRLDFSQFDPAMFSGLGTQTSAIVAGEITPVGTGNYKFGGGGGTLFVHASLTAAGSAGVSVDSPAGSPLTVWLRGANTYTGRLGIAGSIVVLDSATALPAGVRFTLQDPNAPAATAYLGYTENYTAGGEIPVPPGTFIARSTFNGYSPASIIGFDSADKNSPRMIGSDLDLSDFGPFYLGSATAAKITGTLSRPAGGMLYATGVRGGVLEIASPLLAENGIDALTAGHPDTAFTDRGRYSDTGAVALTSANSDFHGGVTLLADYLLVGASSSQTEGMISSGPLGTGTLTIPHTAVDPFLVAAAENVTLHNPVQIDSILRLGVPLTTWVGQSGYSYQNYQGHSLTLAGPISGHAVLETYGNGTVTLSGYNSDFSGDLYLWESSRLIAASDYALGSGTVYLAPGTDLQFTTSFPTIQGGISGGATDNSGNRSFLVLADDSALSINQTFAAELAATIGGTPADFATGPATATSASLYLYGGSTLTLTGDNRYSGGTTVTGGSTLVAGSDHALGAADAPVRVESNSELRIAAGVTVANPVTLADDSRLRGRGTLASADFLIGAGAILAPGDEGGPGELTFSHGLTFAAGGQYLVHLENPMGTVIFPGGGGVASQLPPGVASDHVAVTGTLAFTATLSNPFVFAPELTNQNWESSLGGFGAGFAQTWQIASATAGIVGFTPAATVVRLSGDFPPLNHGEFYLTATADRLLLNFAPASIWTGAAGPSLTNSANWQNHLSPLSDATSTTLYFGPAATTKVVLDTAFAARALTFGTGGYYGVNYAFVGREGALLTIGSGGLKFSDGYYNYSYGRIFFDASLPLNLSAPQIWNIPGESTVQVDGSVTAAGDFSKQGNGTLALNAANSLTGAFLLDGGTLRLGHNLALGAATLVLNGDHEVNVETDRGDRTLANPVRIESTDRDADVSFGNYGGRLSLLGPLTLAAASGRTSLFVSGATLTIAGPIGEEGSAQHLHFSAYTSVILSGANTYSGGTSVSSGSLIFAHPAAIPATGGLSVSGDGYLGVAFGTNLQAGFIDKLSYVNGSIGFDSPPGGPPLNVTEDLDFRGFSSDDFVRIGSATSAVLSGHLTLDYNVAFGGGGGRLIVASPLGGDFGVSLYSPYQQPLTLVLAAANTFRGDIAVNNSALILDHPAALPADAAINLGSTGYVGYSENYDNSPASFAHFISHVRLGQSDYPGAIIGIDSADINHPRTITDQSIGSPLSAGEDSFVSFGTASSVIIGPGVTFDFPSVADGYLYLDAVKGGRLIFAAPLDERVHALVLGFSGPLARDGTVELRAANPNLEDVYLYRGTLALGDPAALGTASLYAYPQDYERAPRLVASAPGLNGPASIANPVGFSNALTLGQPGNANDFTLSGQLSGYGLLSKEGPANITLAGDNSSFYGTLQVSGPLTLDRNTAAGYATLRLFPDATVSFGPGAPAPTLHGLDGSGSLRLFPGSTLVLLLDGASENYSDGTFSGSITGDGTVVKTGYYPLRLLGNNSYTGGTAIQSGTLIAGSNQALGAGNASVVVSGTGELNVAGGVTLANPVSFSDGGRLTGNGALGSAIAIGGGTVLSPGDWMQLGQLTFNQSLAWNPGGHYEVQVAGFSGFTGSADSVFVNGPLFFNANLDQPFALSLESLTNGSPSGNFDTFVATNAYSWRIATATGGIVNFLPGAVTIDSGYFPYDLAGGFFTVSNPGNDLFLIFVPAAAYAGGTFTWTGASRFNNPSFSNPANWQQGDRPHATGAGVEDVIFGSAAQQSVWFTAPATLHDLTFTGAGTAYYLNASSENASLTLTGGVTTVADQGYYTVFTLPVILPAGTHAFDIDGANLYFWNQVSGEGGILKTGGASIIFNSSTTFSGGVTVAGGRIYVTNDTFADGSEVLRGPVGTGPLSLLDDTSLIVGYTDRVTLANALFVGNRVTFGEIPYDRHVTTLRLDGTVTFTDAATTTTLALFTNTLFTGTVTAAADDTRLTFTGGGLAAFAGTTDARIAAITADGAGLIFDGIDTLPAHTLQALNGGYVGMTGAFSGGDDAPRSPADFLAKITAPADFAGTLGFDTAPNSETAATFHGAIDLSGFTNHGFLGLGSATNAELASDVVITPAPDSDYRFGGGGGHLNVSANLTSPDAGLSVVSPPDYPLTVVLKGANSFSGTVHVAHSLLILDSYQALPDGSSITLGSSGYVSATENWTGDRTYADLLARVDASALDPTAMIGFDTPRPINDGLVISSPIDLTVLTAANPNLAELPYLASTSSGTALDGDTPVGRGLVFSGNILVPQGLTLKLAGVHGGIVTVSSALTPDHGVTSVLLGHPDNTLGADGAVALTGANTYTGGTTLLNGSLLLTTSSHFGEAGFDSGPLGLGPLTIGDNFRSHPSLVAEGAVTLANDIFLNNTDVSLGRSGGKSSDSLTLAGTISGSGYLSILSPVTFGGANTFNGSVNLASTTVTAATDTALGSPDTYIYLDASTLNFTSSSPVIGTLGGGYNNSVVNLAGNTTLTLTSQSDSNFFGSIAGNGASLVKTGPGLLRLFSNSSVTGNVSVLAGTLALDGASLAPAYLIVADEGTASLVLQHGATLTTHGDTHIGNAPGSAGTVLLDSQSTWTIPHSYRYVTVGDAGNGTVTIQNGSALNAASFNIGYHAGITGLVTVTGDGSLLSASQTLDLSSAGGTAILNIFDGARVESPMQTNLFGPSAVINLGDGGKAGILDTPAVSNNGALNFNHADNLIFAATISGTGTVSKAGPGTLTLTAANSYGGGTTIAGGTLVATNSQSLGTGGITLNGGRLDVAPNVILANPLAFDVPSTLGGNGTFASPITANANVTLAPGNSPGTLTFANSLTWAPGGSYAIDVASATGNVPGVSFDTIVVSGGAFAITATEANPFNLRLTSLDLSFNAGFVQDFNAGSVYSWQIGSSATGITGFSSSLFAIDTSAFANPLGGGNFSVSLGGLGGDTAIYLNFSPAAVPEPSTWALLLAGLGFVALALRRRRRV